jgi:hypothetical protein
MQLNLHVQRGTTIDPSQNTNQANITANTLPLNNYNFTIAAKLKELKLIIN